MRPLNLKKQWIVVVFVVWGLLLIGASLFLRKDEPSFESKSTPQTPRQFKNASGHIIQDPPKFRTPDVTEKKEAAAGQILEY
ncbi:MAG: hypothetical protein ABH845_04775 [Candidatus Omnitrophota bacterium]